MNDKKKQHIPPGEPQDGSGADYHAPSAVVILITLILIGLVCVAGYFFLMKLIAISRQEDCLMSGRRNCEPILIPNLRSADSRGIHKSAVK